MFHASKPRDVKCHKTRQSNDFLPYFVYEGLQPYIKFVATGGCRIFFPVVVNFSEKMRQFMNFLGDIRNFCVIQDGICVEMFE